MLVGYGYKDELEYGYHKRAISYLQATRMGSIATLVVGFTPLNCHKK